MGMDVKFTDNSMRVCAEIEAAITAGLHEAGGEFLAQVVRNTRENKFHDGGDTKKSFDYKVVGDTVYVGSNAENAIWEEYGTGIHAEKGDGRKTPWVYYDPAADSYFTTKGKKGTRALRKAMNDKAPVAKKIIETKLGAIE